MMHSRMLVLPRWTRQVPIEKRGVAGCPAPSAVWRDVCEAAWVGLFRLVGPDRVTY